MVIVRDKYLERSHTPYSWRPLAVTYLIVAVIILSVVVVVHFLPELDVEIINGLPFVTDTPGLDRTAAAKATEWKRQPRSVQSIRFARLIPVPDQVEVRGKPESQTYSLGRQNQDGSSLPRFYCRIFSDSDLMSRLVMGTIYYRIY